MRQRWGVFLFIILSFGITVSTYSVALGILITDYNDYKNEMWQVLKAEPCLRMLSATKDIDRAELIFLLHQYHIYQFPLKYFCDGEGKILPKKEIELLFDEHTYYQKPTAQSKNINAGIGIDLMEENSNVIIIDVGKGSIAAKLGLKRYDRVLRVGTVAVKNIWEAADLMIGKPNTEITITILRNKNIILTKTLHRETRTYSNISWTYIPKANIGYLKIEKFIHYGVEYKTFLEALGFFQHQNVVGIVLDLRGNAGGLILQVQEFLADFLGLTTAFLETIPGNNVFLRPVSTSLTNFQENSWLQQVPLIVLVDRFTFSSAEIFVTSLALHQRARVVGENTGGKGTIQWHINTRSGKKLILTTERWSLIDGSSVDKTGFIPQIDLKKVVVIQKNIDWGGVDEYYSQDEDLMKTAEILYKEVKKDK